MELFSFEVAWARVAFETLLPGSPESGLRPMAAMDVEGFVRVACRHFSLRAAAGFRMAVWVATLAPVFVLGRLATLGRLAQAERELVLERLFTSDRYSVRSLALLLKTVASLLYAGDPAVRARLYARPAEPAHAGGELIPLGRKPSQHPHAA